MVHWTACLRTTNGNNLLHISISTKVSQGTKPPKETSITPIPAKVDEDAITPATSIFEAATAKQQASVVESEQPSATGDTGSSPDDEIEVIHRTGSLASGVHTKGSEEVLADAIAGKVVFGFNSLY